MGGEAAPIGPRERIILGGLIATPPIPPLPAAPAARGRASSLGGLRERGVVRVNDARRLVVSFMLSGAYDWSPPARVVLELADGQKFEVEVEVKSSTQAEPLTAGSRVRLVMNLERALPAALINIYLPTTPEGVIEIVA
jgi:hypothetical protein